MASTVTKEDVKEIVEGAVGHVSLELKHVNEALIDIKKRFESLPCDRLSNDVKELSVRFQMRVAEFEKTAEERKKSQNLAWAEIRKLQQDRALKSDIDKINDKKETRIWAALILLITFVLNTVGYMLR